MAGLGAFREFLPNLSQPRFQEMQKQDAHEYARCFIEGGRPPWLRGLYRHWQALLAEPFRGITTDGRVRPGLYQLEDEGVEVEAIAAAVQAMLALLTPEQRQKRLCFHIDAPEWRQWSNPEFLLFDKGIRLDEQPTEVREAVLAVLAATLSPEGYAKALAAMRINGFLGELVRAPAVMNEHSYNFVLFGEVPAATAAAVTEQETPKTTPTPTPAPPWGFSFYGHHLCLNAFFVGRQMVLSPWFTGAEPNAIDSGPHAGTRILQIEEEAGLQLMRSLTPDQQRRAQTYQRLHDPAEMPHGRWNHDDQRHLCGAARDNRVVPYEGVCVAEMAPASCLLVEAVFEQYLLYLPAPVRARRMVKLKEWYAETFFSWIGGYGDSDAFYYRLQSPVILVEFDHHSGVFLTNSEPRRFHIHTLLRTPNGGDYGMALRPLIPGRDQVYVWEGEQKESEGRDV